MSLLLQCNKIKKDFGDRSILKEITFDLEEKERVGLVGKNGGGKTTLANIIYGNLNQDGGNIVWHKNNIEIGYLRQSIYYDSNTIHNLFLEEDQMDQFLYTASLLGAKKVEQWEDQRFMGLSGGEKTKLALAHIFKTNPELLILDEPTNHLDFQGITWLAEALEGYDGTILIISHDRYFLDKTVNRIIEIDEGVVNDYKGNYTFYREEKKKRYESQLHAYTIQEAYKQKIQQEIRNTRNWSEKAHRESTKKAIATGNKFGGKEYNRVKAKKMDNQIKSRLKRLEKIKVEGAVKPKEEQKIKFTFNQGEKKGKTLMEAKDLKKSFGDRILFCQSNFYIQRGEKIGIFGENGCGKTTLIKGILGEENLEGEYYITPSARIGYMSQDIINFENEKRMIDIFDPDNSREEGKIRMVLANLGFEEEIIHKKIKNLSMGERTKLKIAELIIKEYDLLILDEPTNHLDLHAREQLEEALEGYEGTILLITHDRYMLERICNKLLVFENQGIKRMEYGFKEFMNKKKEKNKSGRDTKKRNEEERMILENRIAYVLSELSNCQPASTEYLELDEEFKSLIDKRNTLTQSFKG